MKHLYAISSKLLLSYPQLDNFLNAFISQKVNSRIAAFFRIIFSLLNIIMIFRYFQFFEVIWFQIQNAHVLLFLNASLYAWLIVSILLLLGIGGRWIGSAQLLLSVFILRNGMFFGISEIIHLVCSWVFVVSRTDTNMSLNNLFLNSNAKCLKFLACPYEHSSILGIFILGYFFGMLFLCAGLDKLIDPLWLKGIGFYTFTTVPWILPESLKFISELKWVNYFCNYATILVEIGFFFFFPFMKFRLWAVLGFMLISLGLIWPFNIFFIGDFTFLFSFLLLGICKKNKAAYVFEPISINKKTKLVLIALSTLLILTVLQFNLMIKYFKKEYDSITVKHLPDIERFDRIGDLNIAAENVAIKNSFLIDFKKLPISNCRNFADLISWYISPFEIGLFSSKHLIGLYAYRIVVINASGERLEPIKYFLYNKNRGEVNDELFSLNIFLSYMYTIGDFAYKLSCNIEPSDHKFIDRFVHYSLSKAKLSDNHYVSLLVAPMNICLLYQGQVEQRIDDWREILRYDVKAKKYKYVELPVPQKLQARHPDLPNYYPRDQWSEILSN